MPAHSRLIMLCTVAGTCLLACAFGARSAKCSPLSDYNKQVEDVLRRNWHPPENDEPIRVTITVSRSGKILSHTLVHPARVGRANKAALVALQTSEPLPKPPSADLRSNSVRLTVLFDLTKNHGITVSETQP